MTIDALTRRPAPRPGLDAIIPYKGGASATSGDRPAVKLSSNENALGASPAAIAAYREAGSDLELYPEGSAEALRVALAATYDLEAGRIVCGAGSDEILQMLARAYAGPGDEILFTEHAFLVYRLAALQVGATPVAAPETKLTTDVDTLLNAVTPRTRILMLANPNNPTGTVIQAAEIRRLHAGLPGDVVLVLDGAYAEFMDDPSYEDGLALARAHANVVTTRTFSKIHGLAALRLGWAYGPEAIIDVLHRVRGPFNVNAPAIAAGVAALGDTDFAARSKAHNDAELPKLSAAMADLGILAAPSVGNFVLLRFPETPGKTAPEADAFLQSRGFILRNVDAYGLKDSLRLTIGDAATNTAVAAALAEFMAA